MTRRVVIGLCVLVGVILVAAIAVGITIGKLFFYLYVLFFSHRNKMEDFFHKRIDLHQDLHQDFHDNRKLFF